MSAIFGIIDFDGRPIQAEWIKSMQTDLAHRGPDRQDIYQEKSMFLGHMLLQVTPESIYDTSPYEEDGFVITAHARLDEREAIMDRLNTPQLEREIITDPLLLLRSFLKFGKDFVKDIYGDFAFAIWNKEKKELFCGRDHMGVKPFLYYFEDNRLVFSTEYKSMVQHDLVKTNIDQHFIRNNVLYFGNKTEHTQWKNVYSLKAAHYLTVSNTKFELKNYWKPKYKRSKIYKDAETSAKALKEIIGKAIYDRMRVLDHPIGVPLSGGLDSSTISCIAAQRLAYNSKNLVTVSSVLGKYNLNPNEKDELEYIQAILRQEKNIDAEYVYHNDMVYMQNISAKFNRYFTLFNSYNYVDEALYKKFQSKQVRRIIHGYLGDITASNKNVRPLTYLFLKGKFFTFFKLGFQFKKQMSLSYAKLCKNYFLAPLVPLFIINFWNKIKGKHSIWDLNEVPLKLNLEEKKFFSRKIKSYLKETGQYQFDQTHNFWPIDIDMFGENWDTGASYYNLEMTYPLTDRRVIECVLSIPIEHFISDGFERGLIKKAMKGIVPDLILKRTGKGFYSPGYVQIMLKDIPKILKFLEDDFNSSVNHMIDIERVIKNLKKVSNYKKDGTFVEIDLLTFEITTWIYFNLNFKKYEEESKKMEQTLD